MSFQFADDFAAPDVPDQDRFIFGAWGNEVLISVDVDRTDSSFMFSPFLHLCLHLCVEYFESACFFADD